MSLLVSQLGGGGPTIVEADLSSSGLAGSGLISAFVTVGVLASAGLGAGTFDGAWKHASDLTVPAVASSSLSASWTHAVVAAAPGVGAGAFDSAIKITCDLSSAGVGGSDLQSAHAIVTVVSSDSVAIVSFVGGTAPPPLTSPPRPQRKTYLFGRGGIFG